MIQVVGLGPGSRDYILPVAIQKIKDANLIIGAKRNLCVVSDYCSSTMDLSIGFPKLGVYLEKHQEDNITVVVSGDTGFFSMLDFVKRNVKKSNISVVPGISSLQYFYSRLNLGYEKSRWVSLHGRNTDIKEYLENRQEIGILTDKKNNSRFIALQIKKWGYKGIKIYIGENLSYPEEKISCLDVLEAEQYVAADLSVVVIRYE